MRVKIKEEHNSFQAIQVPEGLPDSTELVLRDGKGGEMPAVSGSWIVVIEGIQVLVTQEDFEERFDLIAERVT